MPPTKADVIKELRRIRFERPPPLSTIAEAAGLHRTTLYEATGAGHLSDKNTLKLAEVLQTMGYLQDHIPRSHAIPKPR